MQLDIETFVRQYLPPRWRKPRLMGMAVVLFSPFRILFDAVKEGRAEGLLRVQATGQVGVLTYLLNRAAGYTGGVGPVYVLDGNYTTFDVQVVVPIDLPPASYQAVLAVLERHLLPAVRYVVRTSEGVSWATNPGDAPDLNTLRFTLNPTIINNKLRFGVGPFGQYTYTIYKDGVQYYNYAQPTELRPDLYLEFPLTGTLPAGFYRVVVRTLAASDGTVKEIEGFVGTDGRVCDLAFDVNAPYTVTRTNTVDSDGKRKYDLTLKVTSSYNDTAPYQVQVRAVGATTAEPGYLPATTNPLSVSVYRDTPEVQVRVTDKNGCRTGWLTVKLPDQDLSCDLAWETISAEVVNGAYRITMAMYSARPNLAPFGYTVKKSDGTTVASGNSNTNPITITLPLSTGAIALTVVGTDNQGCRTGAGTITLPNGPTGGGETVVSDAVVLTYTPSGVKLANGENRVLNADGTIGGLQNQPANLTPAMLPVRKPVNMNYPTANGVVDMDSYGDMNWGDGFLFTNFRRYLDVPWSKHFRAQQRAMLLSLTETEMQAEANGVMKKVVHEIGGNILGEYQPGETFCFTPIASILGKLNPKNALIMDNVPQIQLNWEQSFPRRFGNLAEFLAVYPNASTTTITGECAALQGQSVNLRSVWDQGLYDAEVNQRAVNRIVATIKFLKAQAPQARVASGDLSYTVAGAEQDEFVDHANGTHPGSFEQYFQTQRANFAPVTVGDFTVSADNKTYYEVADFLNVYAYPDTGILEPADWDAVYGPNANQKNYAYMMAKGKAPRLADLSIAGIMEGNSRKMASLGRPTMPIVSFFHYRYERGYTRGNDNATVGIFIGPDQERRGDGAILPPHHAHMHALIVRMSMTRQGSGLTLWSTQKRLGLGGSVDATLSWDRPQMEQSAFRAGLGRLAVYGEYFVPANNPVFDFRPAIKTELAKNFTWNSEDAGAGYRRYNPGSHANANNSDDARTKPLVLTRVIQKNGGWWALVVASNFRQGLADTSNFTVKFAKSQYASLPADVISPTLSVSGRDCLVVEFCLTPQTLKVDGTGTTGGGGNPPVTGTRSQFVQHNITTKRWLGLSTFVDFIEANGEVAAYQKSFIERSARKKHNFLSPCVRWERLEKSPGVYDFSDVKAQCELCDSLGLMIFPRIEMSRELGAANLADFIPESERQRDHTGALGTFNNRVNASFDSEIVREKQGNLLKALLAWFVAKGYAFMLMNISFTNEGRYEAQYATMSRNTQVEPYFVTGLFDYGSASLRRFRQRLPGWYTNIAALNAAWGTNFATFNNAEFPQVDRPTNSQQDYQWQFNTAWELDFYKHRVMSLCEWINYHHDVVKSASPLINTATEMGSEVDGEVMARGSAGASALVRTTLFKQNSLVSSPIAFIRASSSANGKFVTADEIFGSNRNETPEQIAYHALQAYWAGSSVLTFAGYVVGGASPGTADWALSEQRFDQICDLIEAGTAGLPGVVIGSTFTPVTYAQPPIEMPLKPTLAGGGPYPLGYPNTFNSSNPKRGVVYVID